MGDTITLLRRLVLAQASGSAGSGTAEWTAAALAGLEAGAPERDLHVFLGLAPRRLGKRDLALTDADRAAAQAARPGWRLDGWSLDGAARVLALLVHRAERPFAERFADLRRTADAAELIALYRGLPLYPDPAALSFEVGEGLRSSVPPVFAAIAHHSPFPRERFDADRWRHMVLKALFMDLPLWPIDGLDDRADGELALILRDFARERRAAGRPVPDALWRCVGPFAVEAGALNDLTAALDAPDRRGAALALAACPAPEAASLLSGRGAILEEARALGWRRLEETAP
jgi:hypothetical protein